MQAALAECRSSEHTNISDIARKYGLYPSSYVRTLIPLVSEVVWAQTKAVVLSLLAGIDMVIHGCLIF